MAAAEYFNPNGRMDSRSHQPPQQFQQQPPPRSSQASASLNPPYPLSDQPPPYSEQGPRPHSQPPPGQRYPQQTSGAGAGVGAAASAPYPPNHSSMNTHQYPPEKLPQYPPPPPWVQQPGYPAPIAPGLSQAYPAQSYPGPPPQTYPSQAYPGQTYAGQTRPQQPRPNSYTRPTRSRSQSRERRKHHHKSQPEGKPKKNTGMNTFLGAGGGAIIGDLIFPGMGTLGGALLGGIGGHEYGKKRSASNPGRASRRSYSNGAEYYNDDYRRGRK